MSIENCAARCGAVFFFVNRTCGSAPFSFRRILRCGAMQISIFQIPTIGYGAVRYILSSKSYGAAVLLHRTTPHRENKPHRIYKALKIKNTKEKRNTPCVYIRCTKGKNEIKDHGPGTRGFAADVYIYIYIYMFKYSLYAQLEKLECHEYVRFARRFRVVGG